MKICFPTDILKIIMEYSDFYTLLNFRVTNRNLYNHSKSLILKAISTLQLNAYEKFVLYLVFINKPKNLHLELQDFIIYIDNPMILKSMVKNLACIIKDPGVIVKLKDIDYPLYKKCLTIYGETFVYRDLFKRGKYEVIHKIKKDIPDHLWPTESLYSKKLIPHYFKVCIRSNIILIFGFIISIIVLNFDIINPFRECIMSILLYIIVIFIMKILGHIDIEVNGMRFKIQII